jgi:two-component system response regulator ResD
MLASIKILLVDDEKGMRDLIRMYLEDSGFYVDEAASGDVALEKALSGEYQLIILDLMLPRVDGFTICREIRKKMDIPILILTAQGDEIDRVLGLELGADDYVVKPFSPRELVARIKALLRRADSGQKPVDETTISYPNLFINPKSRETKVNGNSLQLTPKEFDLLLFFAKNPGRVFTREQLLEEVWGYDFYGGLRTVDTHVKQLREKITKQNYGPDYITTVWGVGYKFEAI